MIEKGPLHALCVILATEAIDALIAYHAHATPETLEAYAAATSVRNEATEALAMSKGDNARSIRHLHAQGVRYAARAVEIAASNPGGVATCEELSRACGVALARVRSALGAQLSRESAEMQASGFAGAAATLEGEAQRFA